MASSAQKSPGTWGLVHRRDQATRKWGLRSAIGLLEQRTSLVERYHLARLGCHHWLMAGTLNNHGSHLVCRVPNASHNAHGDSISACDEGNGPADLPLKVLGAATLDPRYVGAQETKRSSLCLSVQFRHFLEASFHPLVRAGVAHLRRSFW
jgi:hypothetical protein